MIRVSKSGNGPDRALILHLPVPNQPCDIDANHESGLTPLNLHFLLSSIWIIIASCSWGHHFSLPQHEYSVKQSFPMLYSFSFHCLRKKKYLYASQGKWRWLRSERIGRRALASPSPAQPHPRGWWLFRPSPHCWHASGKRCSKW